MKISTPEIITDIESLNPGCRVSELFHHFDCCDIFEFNKIGKDDLKFKKIPSLDNKYEINENGTKIRNVETKRELKIILDKHHSTVGYYATFVNIKGIVRRVMIHNAVAEAWIGPKPKGLETDHIDRNPHNNHYKNLRYVTHSVQMKNRILSPKIIEQAKENCRIYLFEKVMKPIKLIDPDGKIYEFESHTSCAKFLAFVLNQKVEYIRKQIIGKNKMEYEGYKIIYVNEAVALAA